MMQTAVDGHVLRLEGALTHTVVKQLQSQQAAWQGIQQVSLANVSKLDSAGLAWLYLWYLQRQSAHQGWQLVDLSEPFMKLCAIYGVSFTTHQSEQQSE